MARITTLFVGICALAYFGLSQVFGLICWVGGHYVTEEIWALSTTMILTPVIGASTLFWMRFGNGK